MSLKLSALQAAVGAAARSVAGEEFSSAVEFVPNLDLQHGSLSSDITLKLAAVLKIAPAQAGERLMRALSASHAPFVTICNGYLSVPAELRLAYDPADFRLNDRLVICVAAAKDAQLHLGMLRSLAAALVQYGVLLSLGAQLELYLGDDLLVSGPALNVPALWNRAVTLMVQGGLTEGREQLRRSVAAQTSSWCWVVNGMFGHAEFMSLVQRSSGSVRFRISDSTWGRPAADGLLGSDLKLQSDRHAAALLYYLSGSQPAIELDPVCYRLNERANLVWDLWATQERLVRFIDLSSAAPQAVGTEVLDPGEIELPVELAMALHYLPLALIQAGRQARVTEFIELLRRMLLQVNAWLNSPQFRQRADRADLSRSDRYILTGAQRVISFIISGCCIIGESGGQDTGT
ncbi:MAG: hypothetical protein K1X83_09275 [Oligoflexia bacterium]|nr:hypothetical protein [Oligoflexia bacterium]